MTSVSLVLPNYNHAAELKTSLQYIAEQTRPFNEIIVVDDASTDNSIEVIKGFAERFPAIHLVQNEERQGVPGAVNRGLAAATGEYVILASADEQTGPNLCEALVGAIEQFPDARLAASKYSEWDPNTNKEITPPSSSPLGMWYADDDAPSYISAGEFISLLKKRFVWLSINTAIFHRQTLLDIGGLAPELRWHSDWFATYAIAFRHGFCVVPQSLAWFSHQENSYSARGMRDPRAQTKVIINIQDKLYAPENADLLTAIKSAPAALSPFMRRMIPTLAMKPARYGLFAPVLLWWLVQVARGRRPGILLKLLGRG